MISNKPAIIVEKNSLLPSCIEPGPDHLFTSKVRAWVKSELATLGLKLRLADLPDIPSIDGLVRSRYDEQTAMETSHFDSYRFVSFGNVLVLENGGKDLVACLYEIGLDTQPKISFSLRLVVNSKYERLGIPKLMTLQSVALAIDRGSTIRRGIIEVGHCASHNIHLNKLGWIYTSLINEELQGVGQHFTAEMQLNKNYILNSCINHDELVRLLGAGQLNMEYNLVATHDFEEINRSFEKKQIIIAFLKEGAIDRNAYFFFTSAGVGLK